MDHESRRRRRNRNPNNDHQNKQPHVIPITSAIRDVLEQCPINAKGAYMISTTSGARPISGFSKLPTYLRQKVGSSDWGFHDIRRTVASELARRKVLQVHIERILAHKIPGVAGICNRYIYFDEKKAALEIWGEEWRGKGSNEKAVLQISSAVRFEPAGNWGAIVETPNKQASADDPSKSARSDIRDRNDNPKARNKAKRLG